MADTYLPADVRKRIIDVMRERKLTQRELALRIDVNESTISRFLSGKTEKLSEESVIRIARVFNVSTDFILGTTVIPDKKNYDISELGLSVEAAKNLYTGKVNIVCNLDLALLGTLLSSHLACLRSCFFRLGKRVSLDDVISLDLLSPLGCLVDLGVSDCLALSKLCLQVIDIDETNLRVLCGCEPLHDHLSGWCGFIVNNLENNLPSVQDGIVLLI